MVMELSIYNQDNTYAERQNAMSKCNIYEAIISGELIKKNS